MIRKIVLTGPESSGKTSLAKQLAEALKTVWVPEYARDYLNRLHRPYLESDLVEIAKGQLQAEDALIKEANRFLICDTDLITIKIWSEYKYGTCDDFIIQTIEDRQYDLYLLCDPAIPWEADPLREHPNDRQVLFELYKSTLEAYQKNYLVVSGDEPARLKLVLAHLTDLYHLKD